MSNFVELDDRWEGLNLKIAFESSKELFKATHDELIEECIKEGISYDGLTDSEIIEKIIKETNEDFLSDEEIELLLSNPDDV